MTKRIPSDAIASAIATERGQWWPNNSSAEARAYITEALDRLARDLASKMDEPHRAAFLHRTAGVEG